MSIPACFWVNPSASRLRLMCSPTVWGGVINAIFFNDLSVIGSPGKKATRPCPCGYLGHPANKCRCTPDIIARYQDKISGPLLDRIDMQIQVGALAHDDLLKQANGERSDVIAARAEHAFATQLTRQGKGNNGLSTSEIDLHCTPDAAGEQLLRSAMTRLNWSARAYHRVLKVARTIADLAGAGVIGQAHVAEAIQYRRALREH